MTQILGKTYKADATKDLGRIVDAGSVQCVVTSTAYWGKRNYSVDYGAEPSAAEMGQGSLEDFIVEQVLLGRQVWDALADTGTYWLNIADTNSGSGGAGGDHGSKGSKGAHTGNGGIAKYKQGKAGIAPGQQCLVPERVAIALQEPYYEGLIRNETDRAWLAGMMDADGCITAGHLPPRKAGHNDSYNVFVTVGSVDRPVLEHIQALVGGRGTIKDCGSRGMGTRPFFEWRMNKDAERLLEDLYPYLIGKRLQAQVAWTLKAMGPGRMSGLYAKAPASQLQKRRHQLYEALKDLHAGRSVDIKWLKDVPIPQLQPGWIVKKTLTWDKGKPYEEIDSGGDTLRFAKGGIKPEDPRHVRRPRYASETILMLVKDVKQFAYYHDFEIEPGDVWHFPAYKGKRIGPAPFPEELPRRCIALSTKPGDLVLDPCMGSGTTGRVAEAMERGWIGVDLYKGIKPRKVSAS